MLRPAKKGWLKDYLSFRKDMTGMPDTDRINSVLDVPFSDEALYRTIQPTGLMYGYPAKIPNIVLPDSEKWMTDEKMKILLLESFFTSGYTVYKSQIISPADHADLLHETSQNLTEFYGSVLPETVNAKKELKTEEILNSRVEMSHSWLKSFWTKFFHNSLLFLDVYYYDQWLKNKEKIITSDLDGEKVKIRMDVLKLIACAAHANHQIEKEERSLFEFFLESAKLTHILEEEAISIFENGISLSEIDLSNYHSWLLKKYLLELCILTVSSDRKIEDDELAFLNNLSNLMGFSPQELNGSMIAIQSFILQYWNQVSYLRLKQNYKEAQQHLVTGMSEMMDYYKTGVKTEIRESKELFQLLNKSRTTPLTEEEKQKVHAQLLDILKSLPLFAVLALPGRFVTLPILLKVLPKGAIPSGFNQ